jgi:hypothetical protein
VDFQNRSTTVLERCVRQSVENAPYNRQIPDFWRAGQRRSLLFPKDLTWNVYHDCHRLNVV